MLDVLRLALETMNEEARPVGLKINWNKTKIQTTADIQLQMQDIAVAGNAVEVVSTFTSLGSAVDS